MARIRSVHPGLFTDEAFVSLSPLARLLLIGVWTEADDQGVFEWKPIALKMRILPVDDADVPALLAEMVALNIVRAFTYDGKEYGVIRNFRKYQRPKKPNSIYVLPDEFRKYVALNGDSSEPGNGLSGASSEPEPVKRAPVPQKGEIAPQMEDGGGRVEEVGGRRKKGGADAPADYAFVGSVIRLTHKDFKNWRETYFLVPDIMAELRAADAYYVENPPKDGKWFFAASNWLKREHDSRLRERQAEDSREAEIYRNVL